jgi:hypothetical protein
VPQTAILADHAGFGKPIHVTTFNAYLSANIGGADPVTGTPVLQPHHTSANVHINSHRASNDAVSLARVPIIGAVQHQTTPLGDGGHGMSAILDHLGAKVRREDIVPPAPAPAPPSARRPDPFLAPGPFAPTWWGQGGPPGGPLGPPPPFAPALAHPFMGYGLDALGFGAGLATPWLGRPWGLSAYWDGTSCRHLGTGTQEHGCYPLARRC